MRRSSLTVGFLAAAAPVLVLAQGSFRDGHIRFVEPGVTLQRSTEVAAEDAVANLPFLPGDRVWTDASGRAEFQFEGAVIRLDRRSKLDYVAQEDSRGERIVLRLWSGTLSLLAEDDAASFEIETAGGLVEVRERGLYRVDADAQETRLSVYRGEATLDSGRRRVNVDGGERTYARRGEAPAAPGRFDPADSDEFAQWASDRDGSEAWVGDSRRYLPDELDVYAGELDGNGSWYYEREAGYVWRPYVAASWQPYGSGHWAWTSYGWTWVPNERWGWAPFHYGRWGVSAALGWYWIPGNVWGPAWVSWAMGGDYVGWCPLGRGDRPVLITTGTRAYGAPSPWTYVRRGDVGARDVARRRVEVNPLEVKDLQVVSATHARPARDFRVTEREVAVPRGVRTRPRPAETVPEIRSDRTTTIPLPAPRPGGEAEGLRSEQPKQAPAPGPGRDGARARAPRPSPSLGLTIVDPERAARPKAASPSGTSPSGREREVDDDGHVRHADPNRDVLQRMFRPLAEPRPRREGEKDQARPRGESATPSQPQPRPSVKAAPPPPPRAPSPAPSSDRAVRRSSQKDKH